MLVYSLIKFIKENKHFLLIIFFYFLIRLISLTKLPIFNDEAIYLDWGWRETHAPGYLFYSLYDAKQPLLMWFFGILESILSNPLVAGRLVSVFAGFFTMSGLYLIGRRYFDRSVAVFSSFIYVVVPIFSFYDRQALMESAVAAIGVWSFYFFLRLYETRLKKEAIYLGIILGVGFFIKSTVLIFAAAVIVLYFYIFFRDKNKIKSLVNISFIFLAFFFVDFLLFLEPLFWKTLGTNSRYAFTIREILRFPFNEWFGNSYANLNILFFFMTPLILISSVLGIVFIIKNRNIFHSLYIFWMALCFLLQTLLVKHTSQRYLVPFLPLAVISSGYIISLVYGKWKTGGFLLAVVFVIAPILLTSYQIINPPGYFYLMSGMTKYSDRDIYVSGATSGYGISNVVGYIKSLAIGKNVFVGIAENTGNPESAIMVYFEKSKKVKVGYFDRKILGNSLNGVECVLSKIPVYFVSRDQQLAGLDMILFKLKTFPNPYGKNSIGVYKTKDRCSGKSVHLLI